MCLIIASPKGVKISEALLRETAMSNRDGAGICWLKGGRAHWIKGLMNINDVLEAYKNIEGPHAVHFRLATHGGVTPLLTHPFPITDQVRLDLKGNAFKVLMHNGVYADWQKDLKDSILGSGVPCPTGPWSDTRGVAFVVKQHGDAILNLMGVSRYLVLSGDKTNAMRFFGDWSEWQGLWFSNKNSNIAFPPQSYHSRTTYNGQSSFPTVSTPPATALALTQTPPTKPSGDTPATTETPTRPGAYWRHFTDDGCFKPEHVGVPNSL